MGKKIAIAVTVATIIIVAILVTQKSEEKMTDTNTNLPESSTAVHQASSSAESTAGAVQATQSVMPSGLKIEDIRTGSGTEVKSGDTVTINYKGTLVNGTKFDSSYDRGTPFSTQIGVGQVIKGWDVGVVGMKVGGKRKLTIPSDLAYGDRDSAEIPANSTLIFELELLGIK